MTTKSQNPLPVYEVVELEVEEIELTSGDGDDI